VPLLGWLFWAFVLRLGPNDFHDYWLAGRLLLDGQSPYDNGALAALAAREGLTFSLGGGYSYPLPFAIAMIPFAALPFEVAVTCFNVLSLAAFGGTVAVWLTIAHPAAGRTRVMAAALVAGLYPPVYGTVAMGQANLVLLPLMAAGLWLAPGGSRRAALGGTLFGLTAIVKLVPGALVVPLGLARRWSASAGLIVGAVVTLAAASALAPWALVGSGGLVSNLDPDGYYTNQSINGFVSRLVMNTSRSLAPALGAFDPRPVVAAVTLGLAVATLAALWSGRRGLATRGGLGDGLALALVAATIGAPKTSFWNESILLLAVALVLRSDAPDLRLTNLGRLDRALTAIWFGSAMAWALVWAVEPPRGELSLLVNLWWSASLYGMLALWLMLARRVLGARTSQPATAASPSPAASAIS
jgi:alpha-1,2-mannosyltransferase